MMRLSNVVFVLGVLVFSLLFCFVSALNATFH